MEKKLEKPGEGYQVLHRSFNSALGQEGYSLYLASKYIGVYHYRSHVGDPGNRLPFEPVPAAKQKEALERSEERRVGKECRSRGGTYDEKKETRSEWCMGG